MSNQDNNNVETTNQINEVDVATLLQAKKQLWVLVICCIVGFFMFCMTAASKNVFLPIIGIIIVAFPTILSVRRHGMRCIGMMDYEIINVYSNGKREVNNDPADNMIGFFFGLLATVVVGVILTPIRYIIYCFKYNGACKRINYKPEFKDSMWMPTVVGIAGFFLSLIIASIFS